MLETWDMWVWSLGQEDPLEKEMETLSSILAWKSHEWRSLQSYSSWGRKESDSWWLKNKKNIPLYVYYFYVFLMEA